jgi:SAM-dependent methyltransferase
VTATVNPDAATLLDLVACPACHGALASAFAELRCTTCDRAYGLNGRVPVLIADAEPDADASLLARAHYAILGNPRVYDFHQAHGGGKPIGAQVERALEQAHGTILDVGAGTGLVRGLVPDGTRYVWLDNDTLKLRGLLSKQGECYAVLGDAARLPFADAAVDWTVMVEVSHHLPDAALDACLREAARVTRDRFVFVDQLLGDRLRSKLLWQLDLGRFPRSQTRLVEGLSSFFDVEQVDRFRVNHDHLICICRPRAKAD